MLMTASNNDSAFYENIPVFRDFSSLMEPSLYFPLPDCWSIGIADVIGSTKAIADARYKAVNMAGASVIAAAANELEGRAFPFVFGGDGASFAVPADDAERARKALAASAVWAEESLNLAMRIALVPVAAVRAQGLDVRVARFGPSRNLSYAMFSGGGLQWAEAAMKRGEFEVTKAWSGTQPDLNGLSCRFEEIPTARGIILSLLVVPADNADASAFSSLIEDLIAIVERSPAACRPVPPGGPPTKWPPSGNRYEARAARGGSLSRRRVIVLANTLLAFLIMRFNIRIGSFVPKTYIEEVVENSDFRKFDDGLKMILDCTPDLERELVHRLELAASAGIARYGLHRQDAALMTCFTPSAFRSDHVHFIDGASGGYAAASLALKAFGSRNNLVVTADSAG
jgi:hypothetical protein